MTPSFIDTNILISYCNPFDKFHLQAVEFIKICPEPLYLITTIREEFMKRVQDSVYNILDLSKRLLRLNSNISFDKFKQKLNRELKNDGLLEFIISLFTKFVSSSPLSTINFSIMTQFLNEFPKILTNCINNLTQSWTEIPNNTGIYYRQPFKYYENYIRKHIHYPDVIHLCLAIHESQMKSNQSKVYTFFN